MQCVPNSISASKLPVGVSVKIWTHTHTHTLTSAAAARGSLERTYRVSSQESALADVSSALAKEMSDSWAELQGFSFSSVRSPLLCYNRLLHKAAWK